MLRSFPITNCYHFQRNRSHTLLRILSYRHELNERREHEMGQHFLEFVEVNGIACPLYCKTHMCKMMFRSIEVLEVDVTVVCEGSAITVLLQGPGAA